MTGGRRLDLIIGIATCLVYVGMALYCGVGVLGADPYWYAGDLSMLKLTGVAETNAILPSTIFDSSISPGHLPHWVHNAPFTHIVSWVARGHGTSYFALLTANIVFALATAILIFLIARLAGIRRPVAAAVLFLIFPLTTFFTLSTYSEIFLGFAAALTVLGGQLAKGRTHGTRALGTCGLGICAAGVVLLYFSRDNFVLAVPAFLLFSTLATRDAGGHFHLRRALPFQVATVAAVACKGWLFPAYPNAGIAALLMADTSRNPSNMTAFHSTHDVLFHPGSFLEKFGTGVFKAVVPASFVELIVETSVIVAIVLGVTILRRESAWWALRYWGFTFLGIYVATEAAYTTQNRYIYTVVPLACVFAIALCERSVGDGHTSRWRRQLPKVFGLSAVTLLTTFSVLIALGYRSMGLTTNDQIRVISSQVATTGASPIMVIADNERKMPITYAALPRPVISIDREVNSVADTRDLIKIWKPGVFVSGSRKDREFLVSVIASEYGPNARLHKLGSLDTPGGQADLFAIDPSTGSGSKG